MEPLDEALAKAEAELEALSRRREAREEPVRAPLRPVLARVDVLRAEVDQLRGVAARLAGDLRAAEAQAKEPPALSFRALTALPASWGALVFAALELPHDAARVIALGGLAACALFVAGVGRGR